MNVREPCFFSRCLEQMYHFQQRTFEINNIHLSSDKIDTNLVITFATTAFIF